MSDFYEKYFSNGDFYDGLAKVMYDIRSYKLRNKDVIELAEQLKERGLIPNTSQFNKKKWWAWSKKYVNFLMNGMSTGSVSKEYLMFYAKVSRTIKMRNDILKAGGLVVIVTLIIVFLSKGGYVWKK